MSWDTLILRFRILQWFCFVAFLLNATGLAFKLIERDFIWSTLSLIATLVTARLTLYSYREASRCLNSKEYYGE